MFYADGTRIELGDIVTVPVPSGSARARVVMLGATYEHLIVDKQFLAWVIAERRLAPTSVVVEWVGDNPFAHNDSAFASVGSYLFSPVDQWLRPVRPAAG